MKANFWKFSTRFSCLIIFSFRTNFYLQIFNSLILWNYVLYIAWEKINSFFFFFRFWTLEHIVTDVTRIIMRIVKSSQSINSFSFSTKNNVIHVWMKFSILTPIGLVESISLNNTSQINHSHRMVSMEKKKTP